MAPRIRTIKPEVAKHELLFDVERRSGLPIRFAWAVLPTVCDREGRFKWRPRSMKPDVLPHDNVEFEDVLKALLENGFLAKYRIGDDWFGVIPTFTKHQRVSKKEPASELPSINDADEILGSPSLSEMDRWKGREGKGRELEGNTDSPKPQSGSVPAIASPTFLEFPIVGKDGPTWALTEALADEFGVLFPNLDVRQEARKSLAWVLADPGRRKTASGMRRFLTGWFTRTVNGGGSRAAASVSVQAGRPPSWRPEAVSSREAPWFASRECDHSPKCQSRQQCLARSS